MDKKEPSKELAVITPGIFSERTRSIIDRPTPKNEIDKRPDGFDYVRIGYVRRQLDEAFCGVWSVLAEVQCERMMELTGQLVIKVALTGTDPDSGVTLTKEAYGGGPIKVFKGTKNPVDLANDFKSAEADALKKAASLFGFCSDVYEPVVEQREQAREVAAAKEVEVVESVKKSVAIEPEAAITMQVWQFLVQEAATKKVNIAQLQGFLVEKGWKGEDGKAKPSLVKNKDIPTIEAWIADGPPF